MAKFTIGDKVKFSTDWNENALPYDYGVIIKGNHSKKNLSDGYVCQVKYDDGTISFTPVKFLRKVSKLEASLA